MDSIAPNDYQFALSYYKGHYSQFQYNLDSQLIATIAANEVHHEPPTKKIKLKCEECMITYSSQKRYENHIEKHHTKKNGYRCQYCRSSFRRKNRLMNHCFKAHSDEVQKIERIEQQKQQKSQIKPSIFHSIELLAQSDCKDSSSSSCWQNSNFH